MCQYGLGWIWDIISDQLHSLSIHFNRIFVPLFVRLFSHFLLFCFFFFFIYIFFICLQNLYNEFIFSFSMIMFLSLMFYINCTTSLYVFGFFTIMFFPSSLQNLYKEFVFLFSMIIKTLYAVSFFLISSHPNVYMACTTSLRLVSWVNLLSLNKSLS